MNLEIVVPIALAYVFVTGFACLFVAEEWDYKSNQKGMVVCTALWPITLIILSPVLLVKLYAVTFKRRGLLASWLEVITKTYRSAIK